MSGIFFGLVWIGASWFAADFLARKWKLMEPQFHLLRLFFILFATLGGATVVIMIKLAHA